MIFSMIRSVTHKIHTQKSKVKIANLFIWLDSYFAMNGWEYIVISVCQNVHFMWLNVAWKAHGQANVFPASNLAMDWWLLNILVQ